MVERHPVSQIPLPLLPDSLRYQLLTGCQNITRKLKFPPLPSWDPSWRHQRGLTRPTSTCARSENETCHSAHLLPARVPTGFWLNRLDDDLSGLRDVNMLAFFSGAINGFQIFRIGRSCIDNNCVWWVQSLVVWICCFSPFVVRFSFFFSGSFLFQKEVEMSLTFLDINNKHTIVTFSSQFQFDVLAQKRWFQVFNRKLLNLIPIEKTYTLSHLNRGRKTN